MSSSHVPALPEVTLIVTGFVTRLSMTAWPITPKHEPSSKTLFAGIHQDDPAALNDAALEPGHHGPIIILLTLQRRHYLVPPHQNGFIRGGYTIP
ncbi:hypothetical protein AB5N19_00908 [Seiridium cardinale]